MRVPKWFKRTIKVGDVGPDVAVVKRKLFLLPEGPLDAAAIASLKGYAAGSGLDVTDEVDEDLAALLGPAEADELVPKWFIRELSVGSQGADVSVLRMALGVGSYDTFDYVTEDAVRRFQSQHEIEPDGIVTAQLANLIGEV